METMGTAPSPATRSAFRDAVDAGDIPTIAAYFSQPDVHAKILATEVLVAAVVSDDVFFDDTGYRWFYVPTHWSSQHFVFLFDNALRNGHVDVCRWIYAPERIAYMGLTLGRLLTHVVLVAIQYHEYDLLEFLLSPVVWSVLVPGDSQQSTLNRILHVSMPSDDDPAIQILLAHGADLNSEPLLQDAHCYSSEACLRMVVAEGAFLVGASAMGGYINTADVVGTRFLLRHGVDFGVVRSLRGCVFNVDEHPLVLPLHQVVAINFRDMVALLLHEGFVDVDVRDENGATALMAVGRMDVPMGHDEAEETLHMAALLLEVGADIDARDHDERTALMRLVGTEHTNTVEVLLKKGADSNAQDAAGDTVLDHLKLEWTSFSSRELDLLLSFGANPRAVGRSGKTALDQLRRTKAGRKYLAKSPTMLY